MRNYRRVHNKLNASWSHYWGLDLQCQLWTVFPHFIPLCLVVVSLSQFFVYFVFNKFWTAPYDNYRPTKESTVRAFWVQASPEGQTHKLGVPMIMNISTHQDQFLTQDLLNELVCIENWAQELSSIVWIWLRACLHGGGGCQVGEVTHLGGVKKTCLLHVMLQPCHLGVLFLTITEWSLST